MGTGSIILACAHYGAMTIGCDIDGRSIRGKGDVNIVGNAKQYGIRGRLCDNVVCDFSRLFAFKGVVDPLVFSEYTLTKLYKKHKPSQASLEKASYF